MYENYIKARELELATHGENDGKSFIGREVEMKSTIFIEPGAKLTTAKFFKDTDADQQYQEGSLPNGAVAMDILAVRIAPCITFDVGTDYTLLPAEIQRFYCESFLKFDYQKVEQTKLWLSSLVPQGFNLNPAVTANPAPVTNHEKWGEWYNMRTPIQVAANKTLNITFNPAEELTTPAFGAAITPTFPQSKLAGGGNPNRGYAIRLYLNTVEYMVAN